MDDVAEALRRLAEPSLRDGCCLLMKAFDLTGESIEWEFDKRTQARAKKLIQELMMLFSVDGEIRPKARYIAELRYMNATRDPAFQQFLHAATRAGISGDRLSQAKGRAPRASRRRRR